MQQLRKYSSDDDVDDGDYVEPQPLYSHMYTSPFDVNKDISLIIEKLVSPLIILEEQGRWILSGSAVQIDEE